MNVSAQYEKQTARRGRMSLGRLSLAWVAGGRIVAVSIPQFMAIGLLVVGLTVAASFARGESAPGRFEPEISAAPVTIFDAPRAVYERADAREQEGGAVAGGIVSPEGLVAMVASSRDQWLSDWLPVDAESGLGLTGFHHHHRGPVVDDRPLPPAAPCDCPRWAVQVDALMLWQGNVASRPLYLNPDSVALNTNDLQTPLSVDPRYAVIFNRDQCRSVEVNYFGVWSFAGEAQAAAQGSSLAMNNLAGLYFDDITAAEAYSHAHIKSLEFNMRQVGWGGIRWLQGFRWVEWGQQLVMADTFADPFGVGTETFQVNTLNNLYGWQWGGDATLWNRGGRLRFNGVAKAGIFANAGARQTTVYESDDRGRWGTASARRDAPAFFGEVGINGSYAINDWLSWRAGYVFFWLGGVATPENQLSITEVGTTPPVAQLNRWGSAMLHGVTTGLEARW